MNRSIVGVLWATAGIGGCRSESPGGPTASVAGVHVSPDSAQVVVGRTVQFTATPLDAAGYPLDDRAITWSSSDSTIATVSSAGIATGVRGGGNAVIGATSEGHTGSASVRVAYFDPAGWSEVLSPIVATLRDPVWLAISATAPSISSFVRTRRLDEAVATGVFPESMVGMQFGFSGEPGPVLGQYVPVGAARDPETIEFVLYAADTTTWTFARPLGVAGTLTVHPVTASYRIEDVTHVAGLGVFGATVDAGGQQYVVSEAELIDGGLRYRYRGASTSFWLSVVDTLESTAGDVSFLYAGLRTSGPAFDSYSLSLLVGTDQYHEYSSSIDKQTQRDVNGAELTGALTAAEAAAIQLVSVFVQRRRLLTGCAEPFWGLVDTQQ